MPCSKLYATKIKYSCKKSRRTKSEIKTSFNFAVILVNICPKTEFNPPSTPTRQGE